MTTISTQTQFGFRPGHSTSDVLLLLPKGWQDTLVVGLDITGAFDKVWHADMHVQGLPPAKDSPGDDEQAVIEAFSHTSLSSTGFSVGLNPEEHLCR